MTEPTTVEGAPVQALDDAALRRWLFRARDALGRHRHRLDALNVYPVPDGDTGTNLFLTLDGGLRGFVDALLDHGRAGEPVGIAAGARSLSRSMLFAARGNSGVILSQLVSGFADVVTKRDDVDETGVGAEVFVAVLDEADRRARRAVAHPVEGTILTVVRATAQAARRALESGAELAEVVAAAGRAARVALDATPSQLEALARAGVVDAGGAGFVVVMEALASVVRGEPPEVGVEEESGHPDAAAFEPRSTDVEYEVMYLLDGLTDAEATRLRGALAALGDSVVVAGDAGLRTVHVHTSEPGAAIEAALDVGRPYGIRVTVLTELAGCDAGDVEAGVADGGDAASAELGVVACVSAPGLVPLLTEAGAVVVEDGPGRRVSPAQFVTAARATGARRIVLLPDDGDVILAAEAARDVATEEGLDLVVHPTRHLLQGVAALAVFDAADAGCEVRMREAAAAVSCGRVATATTAADTDAGRCAAGDVLGFVDDRITHLGSEAPEVALAVVRSLLTASSEIVTLVEGAAAEGLGARVATMLTAEHEVEVEVLRGGQPVYELLIGVE